jgi:hypothetical protein
MSVMTELPPAHPDTPQQKATLRSSEAARRTRARFPRGTRVEATRAVTEPGTGTFGTVVAHIPVGNAMGGHLRVVWDVRHPGSVPVATMNPTSLLVVDPDTGRGVVRAGLGSRQR